MPAKTLELNRGHQLVVDLARRTAADADGDDSLVPLLIEQLYDNALLLEGLHPNPAAMVGRLQALMEAAALQDADGDPAAAERRTKYERRSTK